LSGGLGCEEGADLILQSRLTRRDHIDHRAIGDGGKARAVLVTIPERRDQILSVRDERPERRDAAKILTLQKPVNRMPHDIAAADLKPGEAFQRAAVKNGEDEASDRVQRDQPLRAAIGHMVDARLGAEVRDEAGKKIPGIVIASQLRAQGGETWRDIRRQCGIVFIDGQRHAVFPEGAPGHEAVAGGAALPANCVPEAW